MAGRMSRTTSDREDLWNEARALTPRWEIEGVDGVHAVIVGVRGAGAGFSVFFNQDPVYHFDARGRLRRAYCQDALFRSEGTTLARLHRTREPQKTQLIREDLSSVELAHFLDEMRHRMRGFQESLRSGPAKVARHQGVESPQLEQIVATIFCGAESAEPLSPALVQRRG